MLLNAFDQSSLIAKPELDLSKILLLFLDEDSQTVDLVIQHFNLNKFGNYLIFSKVAWFCLQLQLIIELFQCLVLLSQFLDYAIELFEL